MFQKKKVFSLILSFVILINVLLRMSALSCTAITPRWVSINSMDVDMAFVGSTGNASGTAGKQSTATSIEGWLTVFELIDGEWEEVDQWYSYRTRGNLGISGDFVCQSGQSYKAKFEIIVYTGTFTEEETIEVIKTCP